MAEEIFFFIYKILKPVDNVENFTKPNKTQPFAVTIINFKETERRIGVWKTKNCDFHDKSGSNTNQLIYDCLSETWRKICLEENTRLANVFTKAWTKEILTGQAKSGKYLTLVKEQSNLNLISLAT